MICIGKSYIQRMDGMSRLCADVSIGDRVKTLWFSVDQDQEKYFCVGRADAFVMILLISALRYGHEIHCADPMSERLHYQLCNSLIPAIAGAGNLYHRIDIHASLTRDAVANREGVVATGFSGGLDCLYTIMTHGHDCEYPLTHILVDNAVAFDKYGEKSRSVYLENCRSAARFARDLGLETVFVDTNFGEALIESYTNAYDIYRHVGCALALSGLFSMYLISASRAASEFEMDLDICASHEMLIAECVSTEYLQFYSAGIEDRRMEKLVAISDWEPSYHWLHPCFSKKPPGGGELWHLQKV